MNEAALKEAGRLADKIEGARKRLAEAEANMEKLKKLVGSPDAQKDYWVRQSWKPRLKLEPDGDHYGQKGASVEVTIPYGVVQQQLLYAVQRARRELVQLQDAAERIAGPSDGSAA